MNFQAAKFYFEDMFKNVWTTTPIHFAGQEFSGEGISKWVNPVYSPRNMTNAGISNTVNKNFGVVYVACWADNDVDAMGLGDLVVDFMKSQVNSQYRIQAINVDDHGWQSSNKVYMILSFSIEYLGGECSPEKSCVASVGDHDGRAYHLDQPWLFNCPMFTL